MVLVDENTGSDAELAAEAFRRLGLGTVVGARTWGGLLTVSDSYPLVDGSEVSMPQQNVVLFQQPQHNGRHNSGKSANGGGGNPIENRGVVPDIEVAVSPSDHAQGRDPQLDAAVTEALRLLGATPPPTPPPSAADQSGAFAAAADESRAAACERGLSGGRWPFETYAPYPDDEGEDSDDDWSDDADGSSDDDDSHDDGGRKKKGKKGGRGAGSGVSSRDDGRSDRSVGRSDRSVGRLTGGGRGGAKGGGKPRR